MKKAITIVASIGLMALIVITTINMMNSSKELPTPQFKDDAGQAFTKERAEWELKRYRDPKTGKIPANIRSLEIAFTNKMLPASTKNKNFLLSNDWLRRGPNEIGGRTRALAFDVRDENIILAGGVSGGMWRSTNAGQTWVRTTLPTQLQTVTTVTQDIRPGHQDTWYYGSGEIWGNSADISGDGIFKSTNNGQSWVQIEGTFTNKPHLSDNTFDYVWRIIMNHTSDNKDGELYAATARGGIYRSIDGGKTWETKLGGGGSKSSYFTEIVISKKGVMYAALSNYYSDAYQSGIYRSANGIDWVKITPAGFPEKFCRIVPAIAPSDENQVYFVAETPGSGIWTTNSQNADLWHSFWKYTYKDGDGSSEHGTWEDRSENLPRPDLVRGHMNSQGSYNLCLHVKPDNPEVVFLGAVTLYRANDGFKTAENWDWIGGTCPDDDCDYYYRYPNHHADNHKILFLPSNPNVMFTGSDGGVHKTLECMADRVEWESLNNGYFTTQFYCVGLDHATDKSELLVGGMQDNGSITLFTSDPTEKCGEPTRGDGFWCQIPNGGNYVYTSQNSSLQPKIKIFRTIMNPDGSIKTSTRIDPLGGFGFIWNTPYVLDPNNTERMYLAGGKIIWRNNDLSQIPFENLTDGQETGWDSLSNTRTAKPATVNDITALEISTKPANILYYGTEEGQLFRVDNAHEGNPAAVEITGTAFPRGANIGCIAIDPDDAQKAITVFTNYGVVSLFYTENAGKTWEQIAGNLEEYSNGSGSGPATIWVEILKQGEDKIYLCGTSAGLFVTKHLNGAGTAWQQDSKEEIGNMVIDVIDCRHSDAYTLVGTHGGGMFATNYAFASSLPEVPKLLYPANNIGGILKQDTLSWEIANDAMTYDIQVATDMAFANVVLSSKGVRGTKLLISELKQGVEKYYWRVRSVNSSGISAYSQAYQFATACLAPELIYPAKLQKDVHPDIVDFNWNVSNGATAYRLQIATSISMKDFIFDATVSTNNRKVEWKLEDNKKYFWRVAAMNEFGAGEFSGIFNFSTGVGSAVEDEQVLSLMVYPNPAMHSVSVSFYNESSTAVQLSVYDAKGQLVIAPFIDFYLFGANTVQLDVSYLPIGTYYMSINKKGLGLEVKPFVIKR